jgi:hypothetical protein
MTPEQEFDINNALLTLMYEWKTGAIDQRQALKEFKQCLKYYSRMEDVIVFMGEQSVPEDNIRSFGYDRVIEVTKKHLAEGIGQEMLLKECVSFEEIQYDQSVQCGYPSRYFRMKASVIIQKPNPTKT